MSDNPQFSVGQIIQSGTNTFRIQHGQDKDLHVTFELAPVQDVVASSMAGHPVMKDELFVRVEFPGNNLTKIFQPATQDHIDRWPAAYARYVQQATPAPVGWRLEDWAQLSRSEVENFRLFNIRTVEELAAVADVNLETIGLGARLHRDRAICALQQAQDGSAISQLTAQMEAVKADNEGLRRQLATLSSTSIAPSSGITAEQVAAMIAEGIAQQSKLKKVS